MAIQLHSLPGNDARHADLPHTSPTANSSDDGLEFGTETEPHAPGRTPPLAYNPHVSRLAALIADATLEEVNLCKTMDVVVLSDNRCFSEVVCRMREGGQDASPIPGPKLRKE